MLWLSDFFSKSPKALIKISLGFLYFYCVWLLLFGLLFLKYEQLEVMQTLLYGFIFYYLLQNVFLDW